MKTTLLVGALAGLATANISFHWVNPTCKIGEATSKKCLTGQHCTTENKCIANIQSDKSKLNELTGKLYPVAQHSGAEKRQVTYSTDGKCGPNNGGLQCNPNSTVYKGTCCSPYGWCGSTADHCGTGCTSGCTGTGTGTGTGTTTAAPRDDGRCGKDFGGATCDANGAFGGCCSAYGYCGKTDGHCLPANGCQNGCTGTGTTPTPPAQSTTPAQTGVQTKDGSCGANAGNTVCGTWANGACCSMYGFCGATSAHCGEGCQSGPCTNAPAQPAPAASPAPAAAKPGSLVKKGSSGVPAMHAGLMPNGQVVFLDKVENYTQLKLPNGQYAYSSEYNPNTGATAVPLAYKTNAFCSGGIFLADGTFVSLGGNAPLAFMDPTVGDGFRAIRKLKRGIDGSGTGQAWVESGAQLSTARWYASVQIMPDNRVFVASGSLNGLDPGKPENNNPTYEWLGADGTPQGGSTNMDILVKNQPYYMYPFIHLMRDGNLFVQVAKSAQIFNAQTGTILKTLPDLPGMYRSYPNTGGSVMMPLTSANNWNPDIIICGGGPYQDITAPGDPSCGRIKPLDANPTWEMDSMPEGRVMVEGCLLADGTIIFANGARNGAQGFGIAQNPAFEVLIYDPVQPKGKRFTTGPTSDIPRLYHSVTLLLLDGTLLISGSNPVEQPVLKADANNPYITEFRNEVYTPPYLQGNPTRPTNVAFPGGKTLSANGSKFTVTFTAPAGAKAVKVSLYYGGFVTHSVHMGHRMAILDTTGFQAGKTAQSIQVTMPPNRAVTPAGPYVVYVLVDGVPALGQFVMVQ